MKTTTTTNDLKYACSPHSLRSKHFIHQNNMSQCPNRTKRVPQKDPVPLPQSDSAKSALSALAASIKTGQSVTGISSLVVLTEGKTQLK